MSADGHQDRDGHQDPDGHLDRDRRQDRSAAARPLRLARLARQLSQEQLADAAGVSRQAVAGFESGRYDPSLAVALRLAAALGTSVEALFGHEDHRHVLIARWVADPGRTLPTGPHRVSLVTVGDQTWAFPLVGMAAHGMGFLPATATVGDPGAHTTDGRDAMAPGAEAEPGSPDPGFVAPGATGVGAEGVGARADVAGESTAARGSGAPGRSAEVGGSAVVGGLVAAGGSAAGASTVAVTAVRPPAPTVVVAGCDPALALLAAPLAAADPPVGFVWWPCSSQRALALAAQGAVHAAGVHRPVGSSRTTVAAARTALGPDGGAVVGFAAWSEGIAVADDHADRIRSVRDLPALSAPFANREPGAEARALVVAACRRVGVVVASVPGWDSALSGHVPVAAAVAGGLAGAGVTSGPVARSFGLPYLALADEQFELVVSRRHLASTEVRQLLAVLGGHEVRDQLGAIDGYDPSACGDVLATF